MITISFMRFYYNNKKMNPKEKIQEGRLLSETGVYKLFTYNTKSV